MKMTADGRQKLGTLSCMSLIINKIIGTGIYSNPSIIFRYVNGNVGIFLSLFGFGGVIILCGLIIYLEFALNLPFRNGGEKNYLLRVFKDPKGLMGCVYSFSIVLLGFSSGNSYTFGKYVLFAFSGQDDDTEINDNLVKFIGILCISGCIVLHWKYPNQGTKVFNFLGVFKVLILMLIILIGFLVWLGWINIDKTDNFDNIWQFHNSQPANLYNLSVGLLQVIYSFKGWENANYVLNEINDPYHVLTIAAPAAVIITTVLYFFVIISYLIVIPKDELLSSGVLCAGIFFNKIFGKSITSRLLPILISLSNLGNVMVVSYAHSLVNQELAANNYIPYSKFFQNFKHSLLLHWVVTVIVLIAPPSKEIYEFIVNLYIYPGTWINVLLTGGLIYLKLNKKKEFWGEFNPIDHTQEVDDFDVSLEATSTYSSLEDDEAETVRNRLVHVTTPSSLALPPDFNKKIEAPYICIIIFFFANLFLAIFPFIPPLNAKDLAIPFWVFPVIGTGVLILGATFFYVRPYWNTFFGSYEPIKYEDEYKADEYHLF